MKNIIIVEDDLVFCKILSNYLSRQNFQVYQAASVAAAENLIAEFNIDLAVIDYRLPGEDGISLTSKMSKQYPHIKVVLMSRVDDLTVEEAGKQAGAVAFLQKPFSPAQLLDLILSVT